MNITFNEAARAVVSRLHIGCKVCAVIIHDAGKFEFPAHLSNPTCRFCAGTRRDPMPLSELYTTGRGKVE